METYQHILLAVDFFEQAHKVSSKAKALADAYRAKMSMIHVVDSMPVPDAGFGWDASFDVDLTNEMINAARKKLLGCADQFGVSHDCVYVELGSPKYEITRVAEENNADLIVMGSHGRHGLSLLLGSTATGVLHHAKCDVLAVRLKDGG